MRIWGILTDQMEPLCWLILPAVALPFLVDNQDQTHRRGKTRLWKSKRGTGLAQDSGLLSTVRTRTRHFYPHASVFCIAPSQEWRWWRFFFHFSRPYFPLLSFYQTCQFVFTAVLKLLSVAGSCQLRCRCLSLLFFFYKGGEAPFKKSISSLNVSLNTKNVNIL